MDYWEQTKILTAYHESGHAVACWALGGVLIDVCITDYDKGYFLYQHPGLNWWRRSSIDDPEVVDGVKISMAGINAQSRKALQLGCLEGVADFDVAGREDCIETMAKLHLIAPTSMVITLSLEEFYVKFGKGSWAYDSKIWRAIEAVANGLLEKRRLTGQEAVAVILQAWGDRPLPPKALALELHKDGNSKEDSK